MDNPPEFHLVKAVSIQNGDSNLALEYQETDSVLPFARVLVFDNVRCSGRPSEMMLEFNRLLRNWWTRHRPGEELPTINLLEARHLAAARHSRKVQ